MSLMKSYIYLDDQVARYLPEKNHPEKIDLCLILLEIAGLHILPAG